jgi:hypothetical protein
MSQIHHRRAGINSYAHRSTACGVQDRTAADLIQIRLIIEIELEPACECALERTLEQIEAVLRESYPEDE